MKSTQERLNEIKQKGYHLEFGDVFNDRCNECDPSQHINCL